MAPVTRRQARMVTGIAAFLIIHSYQVNIFKIVFQYFNYFIASSCYFSDLVFHRFSRVFNAFNRVEVARSVQPRVDAAILVARKEAWKPHATFSVPSHAHEQTATCDNFYLSHKNWCEFVT